MSQEIFLFLCTKKCTTAFNHFWLLNCLFILIIWELVHMRMILWNLMINSLWPNIMTNFLKQFFLLKIMCILCLFLIYLASWICASSQKHFTSGGVHPSVVLSEWIPGSNYYAILYEFAPKCISILYLNNKLLIIKFQFYCLFFNTVKLPIHCFPIISTAVDYTYKYVKYTSIII